MEFAQIVSVIGEAKMAVEPSKLDIADDQIGLIGNAVSNDGPLDPGKNGLNVRFVEREHDRPVERHTIHKFEKRGLDFLERIVMIEMFAVDGRHDRHNGREEEKRAVTFVGFDDHVIALSRAGIGSGCVDATANNKSRVESRCRENGSDQRSSRGLPVRACHGNSVFQAHQLGEHLGAGNYGDLQLAGFDDFRIIRTHRRGRNHNLRTAHVLGLVAFENFRAEIAQALGNCRRFHVRAGDGVAEREEHFRDAAHSAAADAD